MKLEEIMDSVKKYGKMILLSGSLSLGLFLSGCSKKPENPLPVNASKGVIEQKAHIEELTDYFPLNIGNSWEYKIIIPIGGDYYFIKNYMGKDAPSGIERKDKQGEFLLEYSIIGEEDESFKLDVEKDELGIFDNSEEVYFDAIKDPFYSGKSKRIIQLRVLKEEPRINSKGFTQDICSRYMDQAIIMSVGTMSFVMEPIYEYVDISTQGGEFRQCIKQNIEINPKKRDNIDKIIFQLRDKSIRESPFDKGWKEISYFAPNVGLVKREQFDREDNLLNITELISYKNNK